MSNNFTNYLYEKGLSHSTVKTYHRLALEFITWLDSQNTEAENVNGKDIMAYMQHLQKKGHVNFTRNLHLNIIKHFFNWQIANGHRENNPARHIKIRGNKGQTLYPILSPQELDSLYQNYEVPNDQHKKAKCNWFKKYKLSRQRNKTIIGLMLWQGLITPEINNLKLTDVKLREGKIFISSSRKSGGRTLELKPHQIIELMEYQLTTRAELLKYQSENTDNFFVSVPAAGKTKGGRDDSFNVWKRLSSELKKINPRFVNFKQVRASVITIWLSQYNLRQVQYMAGHKYVSTTERYLVNQVEDLQNDIEKYHPVG